MKIYTLTIMYDEDTDAVEYIQEMIQEEDDGKGENVIIELDEEDFERSSTIEVLQRMKNIAEA